MPYGTGVFDFFKFVDLKIGSKKQNVNKFEKIANYKTKKRGGTKRK
jgi:hypothetical protein